MLIYSYLVDIEDFCETAYTCMWLIQWLLSRTKEAETRCVGSRYKYDVGKTRWRMSNLCSTLIK